MQKTSSQIFNQSLIKDFLMSIIISDKLIQLESIREQIASLAIKCSNFVVSLDSLDEAKTLAKDAKKIESLIEDRRKEITKPILDEKKQIDDFAKSLTNDLNESIKTLRNQILNVEKEIERKRQEELKRIAEENARREAELRKQEEELKAKQAEASKPTLEESEALMRAKQEREALMAKQAEMESQKSSNLRKVWTFEVTNQNEVPNEYLMINEKAVKAAIANGTREIPGIRIYQDEQLVIK